MNSDCLNCGAAKDERGFFCRECLHDEYICYRAVKDYLRQHPNSNAMQISNETGISVTRILQYIRDGSLTVVEQNDRRRRY